jgi:endogenous inhibitor of DNA gyrase (YacG/DUF329 family)
MSSATKPPPACPVCGRPAAKAVSPFCSRRCADIDLGRWLKGGYAIPGRPEDDVDKGPVPPPGRDEPPEN